MPETLTDEQILGIDDSPASEVSSESVETAAPIEQEQAGEEARLGPSQEKPETLAQPRQTDKTQQPAKQQADKSQQQPGQPDQAQETIQAKAAELERADNAFLNGDAAGIAQTFDAMFEGNAGAEANALRLGMMHLEQHSPEHFSSFARNLVSEQLSKAGIGDALRALYESATKANDRGTAQLIEEIAQGFSEMYGIGTGSPESEFQGFTSHVGSLMDTDVPAEVAQAFGEQFAGLMPAMQQELQTAARLEIRDRLSRDKTIGAALQKLSKGYNAKEGASLYYDTILPRVRTVAKLVAANLSSQYREVFSTHRAQTAKPTPRPAQPAPQKPAPPRSMAEANSRGMNLSEILKAIEGETSSGSYLPQEEANAMSDRDILDSARVPLARKSWRPESIFDED